MNTKLNNQNIDELISTFGKRVMPDEKVMGNARVNVRAHWQASVKKQKRQRTRLSLLRMAASFVALAAVLFFVKGNLFNAQAVNMGEVLFAQGHVQISDDQLNWHALDKDETIQTDTWIKTTEDSFINFALSDQSQIRLNANTILHLDSLKQINLLKGEIYHDADTQNSKQLVIKTPFGNVEHIGTRYAVSVNDSALTVKVRNGLVKLASDAITTTLEKGELLELNRQGQFVEKSITPYDDNWLWTKQAMNLADINHQSLAQFVSWYAHENGLEVQWNNLQSQAKSINLTGDFTKLNDEQLLKTVFLSTKFDFEINHGILSLNP
jgi:hypothetical protein